MSKSLKLFYIKKINLLKTTVFRDVTLDSLVHTYEEDSNHHSHHCETLKSHIFLPILAYGVKC
jgi:hypothetical protein